MDNHGNGQKRLEAVSSSSFSPPSSSSSNSFPSLLSFSSLSSYLASRYIFSRYNGLGGGFNTQYNGRRDLNLILGYDDVIDAALYRYEYERGGLAERIVKIFPKSTWGNGFDVKDSANLKRKTQFEKGVEDLNRSLGIHSRLYRASVLSYLNHFSIILIGAPGDPSEPLPRYRRGGEIAYLRPYGEDKVKILELVGQFGDSEGAKYDKRFGLPLYYQINPNGFTTSQQIGSQSQLPVNSTSSFDRVHWSRVIHLVRSPLDNDLIGEPILRSVWNLLHDLKKETGGVAEADLRRAWPKFHANYDKDSKAGQTERDDVKAQLEELEIGLANSVRSKGMELTSLSTGGKIGMKENVEAIIQQVGGTIGVPWRLFIGGELGKANAETDVGSFNRVIMELRSTENDPIIREFYGRLIEFGYLPQPKNPNYEIIWPEEEELDEEGKARVAKLMRDSGCFNEEEIRDRIYGYGPRKVKGPEEANNDPNRSENDPNKGLNDQNNDKNEEILQ